MLLAVDIGNTTIGFCGITKNTEGTYHIVFRFKIDNVREEDSAYFVDTIRHKFQEMDVAVPELQQGGTKSSILQETAGQKKNALPDFRGIAISSVVPAVTDTICEAMQQLYGQQPYLITAFSDLGIQLLVDAPDKVGIDRLCDASYAAAVRDIPVITVDLGTSTTINVIDSRGNFLGGSIMPGLETGFRALTGSAAQLYDITLHQPEHFIGHNTEECLNIGVVAGMAGAVDGLVRHMEAELGQEASLVLTGGCAGLVSPLLQHEHVLDPDLLYKGIAYLYDRNRA